MHCCKLAAAQQAAFRKPHLLCGPEHCTSALAPYLTSSVSRGGGGCPPRSSKRQATPHVPTVSSRIEQFKDVQEGLEVKLGCAVTNIDRSGPTPVVTYRNSNTGADVTIRDADFVVVRITSTRNPSDIVLSTCASCPAAFSFFFLPKRPFSCGNSDRRF